jgi:hypothetical protein
MSRVQLRQQSKAIIDELSTKDLQLVRDFLAFLASRQSNAATLELLAIPGFQQSFLRGVKDVKTGRTYSWRYVHHAS